MNDQPTTPMTPTTESYTLTPLGAAVAEALPDQQKVKKIERDFKRKKVCPVSEIFDESALVAFYRERGEEIKAPHPSAPSE